MKRDLLIAICALATTLTTQAQVLQRVVVEKHTGAWCGHCPDGALIMEQILDAEPNAIEVAIHQGDGMQINLSSAIRSFYNPAFPQATINRKGAPVSRGSWAYEVGQALEDNPVVAVSFDSVSYNPATRHLHARIKATFVRDTTGQMRFNLYLTESNVTGTGANFDQVNYYDATPGHPLQGLGNPILGYVHNNVLRHALGSAWGTANIIPATVTANQEVLHTYEYIVPVGINIENVQLVAMVNHQSGAGITQRPTLNSDEMPLAMAVGIDDGLTANASRMQIWPNPANAMVNVSFTMAEMGNVTVEVYNASGQRISVIAEGFTNSGAHTVTWSGRDASGNRVADGVYFVRMYTEAGESRSQRVFMQAN